MPVTMFLKMRNLSGFRELMVDPNAVFLFDGGV